MVKLPLTNRRSNVKDAWRRGIRKVSSLAKLTGVPLSTTYKYVAKLKKKQTLNPLPVLAAQEFYLPKNVMYLEG
jgi:hypothetical protein